LIGQCFRLSLNAACLESVTRLIRRSWTNTPLLGSPVIRWRRTFGGIHIAPDDFEGRMIGAVCGKEAWTLALRFFEGSAP